MVDGLQLDEFIRRNAPPQRDRLQLFQKICEAIHYAHQRGIIHRDIKPGNILVDAQSRPKILDFGLAKITDADLTATLTATEAGHVQGTLAYMSPEQARGQVDEIDVRSDVYAMGVVLYEMLTGRLPYDVSRTSLPQAVDQICQTPPNRPRTTSRFFPSDLETILLKALEKEPARRYNSAAALGEDIRRYLDHQPILARRPSTGYQLRKMIARHRVVFVFIAALFTVVLGFAAWMTLLYGRANRLGAEAVSEAQRASGEARKVRRSMNLLTDIFSGADPLDMGGRVTAREVLARGVDRVLRDLMGARPSTCVPWRRNARSSGMTASSRR